MWMGYVNVILIPHAYLNASISKSIVPPGDSFEVYGNASSDYVEIVAISPKGGNGTGRDGLYGVAIPNMIFLPRELKPEDYTIYAKYNTITVLTKPDENGNFSLKVPYGRYNISVELSLLCEPGTCYSYPEIEVVVNCSVH
jgi:hypothetical protein